MRNLKQEQRVVDRLLMIAGALFLIGVGAVSVGTEILILSLWSTSTVAFFLWQGLWAICVAFVISFIAQLIAKNRS